MLALVRLVDCLLVLLWLIDWLFVCLVVLPLPDFLTVVLQSLLTHWVEVCLTLVPASALAVAETATAKARTRATTKSVILLPMFAP